VNKKSKKKSSPLKKLILLLLLSAMAFGATKGYELYKGIKEPNVDLKGKEYTYLYIPSGAVYSDVLRILKEDNILIHSESFKWVAKKKKYHENIKAGKFKIKNGINNNALINLLRSGKQEPVRLVFNKVRTKERFVGIIASQIEADSVSLLKALSSKEYLNKYAKDLETAMTLFIPNTYEFWWNTGTDEFMDRMHTEYKRFWNESRINKAKKLNMTPEEVITLASIVEEETIKNDEKRDVAGVYINRLNKHMRLQADPTVRYAIGNFEIKRILNKHLEVDSPYNTYKKWGLPPGPICIPSISSIDAVLNYNKHGFIYFCAKEDFSGYHAFAKTLRQHNSNAEKYRRALNKKRIYK
jgi:UPF0755 protein